MNWGTLLLEAAPDNEFSISAFKGWFADLIYNILTFFSSILYMIWRLLASVVVAIEKVFRSLAGLDTAKKDMVSEIFYDPAVEDIFKNMLAFATAIIIFFTIVKIIQDHYKDKEGGNPYKVVINTFRGLLMFFFVYAAVPIALFATGVVFRGIDAASGGGSVTVAGLVFKAMAADANRLAMGPNAISGDDLMDIARRKHYYRMAGDANPGGSYGKYVYMKMGDRDMGPSGAFTYEDLIEAFPEYAYGVVGADGKTVTPMASWLKSSGVTPSANWWEEDYWDGAETPSFNNTIKENGNVSGGVGYHNEMLAGVSTSIRPTISLNWSPIDIVTYGYSLEPTRTEDLDIIMSVFGTATSIQMGNTYVKYKAGQPVMKSLEESAKKFGFTVNGSVALQDGRASASFSFDMFKPETFKTLLASILINNAYTYSIKGLVELVPEMVGSSTVYGINFNWMKIFAPMVLQAVQKLHELSFATMIPNNEEGEPIVDMFQTDPTKFKSDTFVTINSKSQYLPIAIQQYLIDDNFDDLWEDQLLADAEAFRKQLEDAEAETWDAAQGEAELMNMMSGSIVTEQRDWTIHRASVEAYNSDAINLLNRLGNLLNLYISVAGGWNGAPGLPTAQSGTESVDAWLANHDYQYGFENLEDEIKLYFSSLVKGYNKINPKFGMRPTGSYADAILSEPVYQPIIELNIADKTLEVLTVQDIINIFNNSDTRKFGKVTVNMHNNNGSFFRMIDWDAYGPLYERNFKDIIDIYDIDETNIVEDSNDPNYNPKKGINGNDKVVGTDDLVFATVPDVDSSNNWKVGLGYFTQFCSPFQNTASNGKNFCSDGYWGTQGLTIGNGIENKRYYQKYKSTSLDLFNKFNYWGGETTENAQAQSYEASSFDDVAVTRPSSANLHAVINENKQNTTNELSPKSADDSIVNEFAKNVITFRRLYPANPDGTNQEADKKVLNEWIETNNKIILSDPSNVAALDTLHNFTAEQIDDLMVRGDSRAYLMLTQNDATAADVNNLQSYIGQFSFEDSATVDALYDLNKIHYVIGFVSIIAAVGVYLNFAIGLIQRAVNMSVLYIMSPITIAFFPFDEGAKFKNNFVTQFYKEAISAFAVIVSLNLFIVLFTPVHNAVEAATGKKYMGWIALVAIVAMLPKIRDDISSILGGNSMKAQSITSAWGDAKKVMGSENLSNFRNGMKKAAHITDAIGAGIASKIAKSKGNRETEIAKLEEKRKAGKLGWWGERRLDRLQKGKDSQARIDKAHEALANSENGKLSQEEMTALGLSASEQRRFHRQQKAAESKAKAMAGHIRDANGKKLEGDALKNAVKEEKDKLLRSETFKKSVNGVVAHTKLGRGMHTVGAGLAKGAKTVGGGIGKGLKATGEWIGNTGIAMKLAKDMRWLGNSFVGEMVKNKFGMNGSLKDNKDSAYGAMLRFFDPNTRAKLQKDATNKDLNHKKARQAEYDKFFSGAGMRVEKEGESKKVYEDAAKLQMVQEDLQGSNLTRRDKLVDVLTNEFMKNGEDAAKARQNAENKVNGMRKHEVANEYAKLGGDAVFARGVAGGLAGFESMKMDFNSKDNKERLKQLQKALKSEFKNSDEVKVKLDMELKNQQSALTEIVGKVMGNLKLNPDDKDKKEALQNILKDLKENKSITFDGLVDKMSNAGFGKDRDEVQSSLLQGNAYNDLVNKVQFNSAIDVLHHQEEAAKLNEKGKSLLFGKVGDSVPQAAQDAMYEIYRNATDGDLDSLNENSLGYKTNELLNKYGRDASNPQFLAEKRALEERMDAELGIEYDKFFKKYGASIQEFSRVKKYSEEVAPTKNAELISESINRRNFVLNKVSLPAFELVVNDKLIQDLHEKGDYALAGTMLQKVIDSVREGDMAGAKKLGFTEETVNKMFEWAKNGDKAGNLNALREWGVFDASHLGSVLDNMDSTYAGAKSVFTNVLRVSEYDVIASKMKAKIDELNREESNARAYVNQMVQSVPTIVSDDWFSADNKVKLNIKYGDMVATDKASLEKILQVSLKDVEAKGVNYQSEEIQGIINQLHAFRKTQDVSTQSQISSLIEGYSKGQYANKVNDDAIIASTEQAKYEGKYYEPKLKISNPSTGGAQ